MHSSLQFDKLPLNPVNGKSFLHMAVESQALQILAYLLIDQKMDPNVLSI